MDGKNKKQIHTLEKKEEEKTRKRISSLTQSHPKAAKYTAISEEMKYI